MTAKSPAAKLRKLGVWHGLSIAIFSGLCTIAALVLQSWAGVLVGFLVTLCGVLEYRGGKLVSEHPLQARRYLAGAQGLLFLVLASYCLWASQHIDVQALLQNEQFRAQVMPQLRAAHMSYEDLQQMLEKVSGLFYAVVVLVSLVYQGGLALHYWRNSGKVAKTVTPPPLPQG